MVVGFCRGAAPNHFFLDIEAKCTSPSITAISTSGAYLIFLLDRSISASVIGLCIRKLSTRLPSFFKTTCLLVTNRRDLSSFPAHQQVPNTPPSTASDKRKVLA